MSFRVLVLLAATVCLLQTTTPTLAAAMTNLERHAKHANEAPPFVDYHQYNYGLPNKITDMANLTIAIENKPIGVIHIGLYGRTVPQTVENFRGLCAMSQGYGYHNSTIHRVLRSLLIQGGDFEHGDGTGGYSIFPNKKRFDAENYQIPHAEGCVAMASESRTGLGSQFYMMTGTSESARFLNGKHVVFGQIIDGYRTIVKRIMHTPTTPNNVPIRRISISDCVVGPFVDPHEHDKKKHHRLVDVSVDGEDDLNMEGPRSDDFEKAKKAAAAGKVAPVKGEEKDHHHGGAHDKKQQAKQRAQQRHERLKAHLDKKHVDEAAKRGKPEKKH